MDAVQKALTHSSILFSVSKTVIERPLTSCIVVGTIENMAKLSALSEIVVVLVSLQLLLLPVLQAVTVGDAENRGLDPNAWPPCSLRDPLMDPTLEKRYGVDVVWQIPSNPKAVIFMAHAGEADVLSYFDPGPNCEKCYGLPEIRRTVLQALRRDYAVIVVKSIGEAYDCKWPLETSPDLKIVTAILKEWTWEHGLDRLPLAGLGQSAGTGITTALTTRLPMSAIVLKVAPGMIDVVNEATSPQFPPTFFVDMPRDLGNSFLNMTAKIAIVSDILREKGVEVTNVHITPKPLDPLIFSERILCINEKMSLEIFQAYEAAGWVDDKRYLLKNPITEDNASPLMSTNALPVCRASGEPCLLDHVQQEMDNSFAEHCFTSDADDAIFAWLDSTIFPSSDQALVSTA